LIQLMQYFYQDGKMQCEISLKYNIKFEPSQAWKTSNLDHKCNPQLSLRSYKHTVVHLPKIRAYIGKVFRTKIFVESFNFSREISWCYHFQTRNILPVIFKTISKHIHDYWNHWWVLPLAKIFPAARKLYVLYRPPKMLILYISTYPFQYTSNYI
jgi:hypothetical protein